MVGCNFRADEAYRAKVQRETRVQQLQSDTGDVRDSIEFLRDFKQQYKRNPTGTELYDYQVSELNRIKEGADPQNAVDRWYAEHGTDTDGVSTDLQQLARRVMQSLDADGDGNLSEPSVMGTYFYRMTDLTPRERSAMVDAYNDPRVWNALKTQYKAAVVAAGVAATAGVTTGTVVNTSDGGVDIDAAIDASGDGDIGDMDLVEEVVPEFIREGTETEEETAAAAAAAAEEVVPRFIRDATETEEETAARLASRAAAAVDAEGAEDVRAAVEEVYGADGDTGTGLGAPMSAEGSTAVIEDMTEVSDLIEKTMALSQQAYETDKMHGEGYNFNLDNVVPVLFYREGATLYVTFRGSVKFTDWFNNFNPTEVAGLDEVGKSTKH